LSPGFDKLELVGHQTGPPPAAQLLFEFDIAREPLLVNFNSRTGRRLQNPKAQTSICIGNPVLSTNPSVSGFRAISGALAPPPVVVSVNVPIAVTIDAAVSVAPVKTAVVTIDIAITVAVNSSIPRLRRIRVVVWIVVWIGIWVVVWISIWIGIWIGVRIRVVILKCRSAPIDTTVASIVTINKFCAFVGLAGTATVPTSLRKRNNRQRHR
jgi:hypothetical protein